MKKNEKYILKNINEKRRRNMKHMAKEEKKCPSENKVYIKKK